MLVDQTKRMGFGLDQASTFLMAMGQNATDPSMAGFNIPAQVLGTDDFKKMAQLFISPDGHSVRYFVQTDLNPFSTEAMDQVKSILDTAKGAQPNTTLADASISMSGYPVTLRDTRDYYDRDIRLIVTVTVIVVLLILMLLLRAVVASALPRRVGDPLVPVGARHRRAVLPGDPRTGIALERARIGVRRTRGGGRRLQHVACVPIA